MIVVIEREKHAGENPQIGFDITPFSTNWWRPGISVTAGYCVRPAPQDLAEALGYTPRRGPDGYQYRATIVGGGTVGQTAYREPQWGPDPISDGSVQWLREPISNDSLFRTITAPLDIEWIAPDEITVSNKVYVVTGGSLQVAANFAGGEEGEAYRIIARVPYSDGSIHDYAIDLTIVDDQIEE